MFQRNRPAVPKNTRGGLTTRCLSTLKFQHCFREASPAGVPGTGWTLGCGGLAEGWEPLRAACAPSAGTSAPGNSREKPLAPPAPPEPCPPLHSGHCLSYKGFSSGGITTTTARLSWSKQGQLSSGKAMIWTSRIQPLVICWYKRGNNLLKTMLDKAAGSLLFGDTSLLVPAKTWTEESEQNTVSEQEKQVGSRPSTP